uniref:Uncharacterized protein n=1 Tax=Anguilla anguilla TaxID=7936 RepID=A0A0E9SLC0_ANGAN
MTELISFSDYFEIRHFYNANGTETVNAERDEY